MNIERLREKREAYRKAVLRLKEALDENSSNPLLYDGVIQSLNLPMNWLGS